MKTAFLTSFLFSVLLCQSQEIDIAPYIRAFSTKGIKQSKESQALYDVMKFKQTPQTFERTVTALYKYLELHSDRRLMVRTMMFEVLGQREFELAPTKKRSELAMHAIELAYPLKDEQLNAELYALYGDMILSGYDYLFYNLKSLELQREIGFNHFANVQNRFFGVSAALYQTGDYRHSIKYATEGLNRWKEDALHWDRRVYIRQMDILGSGYKKLNIYDSVHYYYQQILIALTANPSRDSAFQKIWLGIARGNIGLALVKQGRFDDAWPLLRVYLETALETRDTLNIAMAYNNLAEGHFLKGNISKSLDNRKKALLFSSTVDLPEQRLLALHGISDLYQKTGRADSSLAYSNRYHQLKSVIDSIFDESNFAKVSRHVAFDNLQLSFERAEFAYLKERRNRNAVLIGIALLMIIILLLYNRRRLKEKMRYQEVLQKQEIAAREVAEARNKIEGFTHSIIEKNELIVALQKQLTTTAGPGEIPENLLQFTLVTDAEWLTFKKEFSKAYPEFFASLYEKLSPCTQAEERLAALIFLQLDNRQIGATLGISPESVARARRRLRTRLNLGSRGELENYIRTII